MSRFKRVRRRQAIKEAQERAAKRTRQKIIVDCRQYFGIRGQIPQSTKHYLYHIARLMENEGDQDLKVLVDQWRRYDKQSAQTLPRQKPQRFFYYLRDHRLSGDDRLVFICYEMIADEYKVQVEAPRFHGLGDALLTRLREWLGDSGGNDMEEVLIDYLVTVFKECAKFRKSLIGNPSSTLGDFGWRAWQECVVKKWGGRDGYLLPTEDELKERAHQNNLFARLSDLQAAALEQGNITLYDSLGAGAAEGDTSLRRLLEEHTA